MPPGHPTTGTPAPSKAADKPAGATKK
jgi:hypothetical protein